MTNETTTQQSSGRSIRVLLFIWFILAGLMTFGLIKAAWGATTASLDAHSVVAQQVSSPVFDLSLAKDDFRGSQVGFWGGASLFRDQYSQLYAGPLFKVNSYLKIGAGLGAQRDETEQWMVRYALQGQVHYKTFLAQGLVEFDNGKKGQGFWYDARVSSKPFEFFELGVRGVRHVGVGPFVQFNLGEVLPVSVWALYAHDPEAGDTASGLAGLGVYL